MKSLKHIAVAVAATIAVVSVACFRGEAADEARRAEEVKAAVERALQKIVTSPDDARKVAIKVVPAASNAETAQGHFRTISVDAHPAVVRNRSHFVSFTARATDARVDVTKLLKEKESERELSFISAKSQSVSLVATADDFQYLLARGNDSKKMNLRVSFEGGKVHVKGNWKLFVFQGPMNLIGSFRIHNQDEVHVVVDTLKINDRNAPPSVIRQFEDKLNQLLNTSDFIFSPKLHTVKIDGQRLVLSSE